MTRPTAAALLSTLALALLVPACSGRAKEDPLLRLSAEESLVEGRKLLEAEKYAKARPYFQHAFEVEPNSRTGREALMLVADTLFLEGGDAQLIQAEAKYRDYQNRFPTSDRAAYAQFQIAESLARRVARPDRDQDTTRKAVAAYEDLIRLFPTSEYVERARESVGSVRESLAEHEFQVAAFYLRFGLPQATAARLEDLLAGFPDYDARDKALYHLALAYRDLARDEDAEATFARLRAEHPSSEWVGEIPKARG
jgi:outer membrane protein assembly factor BamD